MADDAALPENVAGLHRALLRAVAVGRDRQAFGLLYRHFAPLLKAWLERRSEAPPSAEELTQDVMLQVWRDAHTYDARHDPSAWIFGMMRDLAQAARTGITIIEPATARDHAGSGSPDNDPCDAEQVVGYLSEDERHALLVVLVDGKSHVEAADLIGIPLGTLKSRIKRGLDRLRSMLPCKGEAAP